MNPAEIRRLLRQKRNALSSTQQESHGLQALNHLQQLLNTQFVTSSKIALFLSQDGELSTQPAIQSLWQTAQHQVYLPVLETQDGLHMAFAEFNNNSKLKKNQFGIEEPEQPFDQHLTGAELDLVIMPLVGFDKQGNRLGMGGGYYDRSFGFKIQNPKAKPMLIGWAHSCQETDQLSPEKWDVPLDGIITEKALTLFN